MEKLKTNTEFEAQRLGQLLRLNKQFNTALSHQDMQVRIENSEGGFEFNLNNHQRYVFAMMLRGRLKSSVWEGMGNVGYELVRGRINAK